MSGKTPILASASNGHGMVVRSLIRHGADVEQCDNAGNRPLMVAAESAGRDTRGYEGKQTLVHYLDVLNILLDADADPNAMDSSQMTAIDRVCVSNGCVPILKLLIERGGRLAAKSSRHRNKGRTNLMTAVVSGHFELVKFLVEKCYCNVGERSEFGHTLFDVAYAKGDTDVAQYLEQRAAE